jgi:hypothetical protein
MRKRILFISIFILISFFFGFDFKCDDEEKDQIKLLVSCDNSNTPSFNGSYYLNSDNPVGFQNNQTSGSAYFYTITFNDLDSLSVDVTINRSAADITNNTPFTLTIRIYKDNSQVKIKSVTSTGTTTDSIINFTYSYGETST